MRDQGLGEEAIAARFFVTPQVVRQRLKLAAASPKLLDLYAADELTLEQLMAFCVSDDHTRQGEVWDALQRGWNREPYTLRGEDRGRHRRRDLRPRCRDRHRRLAARRRSAHARDARRHRCRDAHPHPGAQGPQPPAAAGRGAGAGRCFRCAPAGEPPVGPCRRAPSGSMPCGRTCWRNSRPATPVNFSVSHAENDLFQRDDGQAHRSFLLFG